MDEQVDVMPENVQETDNQELGVITQLSYGYVDGQGIGMLYNVKILNGATVLFMTEADVSKILLDNKIPNIMNLQGQTCAVNVEGNAVTFSHLV